VSERVSECMHTLRPLIQRARAWWGMGIVHGVWALRFTKQKRSVRKTSTRPVTARRLPPFLDSPIPLICTLARGQRTCQFQARSPSFVPLKSDLVSSAQ